MLSIECGQAFHKYSFMTRTIISIHTSPQVAYLALKLGSIALFMFVLYSFNETIEIYSKELVN